MLQAEEDQVVAGAGRLMHDDEEVHAYWNINNFNLINIIHNILYSKVHVYMFALLKKKKVVCLHYLCYV